MGKIEKHTLDVINLILSPYNAKIRFRWYYNVSINMEIMLAIYGDKRWFISSFASYPVNLIIALAHIYFALQLKLIIFIISKASILFLITFSKIHDSSNKI